MFIPGNPDGRSHADRGISAGNEADQHDQGKVLCRIPAEEIKGSYAEECRCQRVKRTADCLVNGIIRQDSITVRTLMRMHRFTDSVEYDDRFVHGITKNCQDSCQERCIHFQMEECKNTQNHQDIVRNGDNC